MTDPWDTLANDRFPHGFFVRVGPRAPLILCQGNDPREAIADYLRSGASIQKGERVWVWAADLVRPDLRKLVDNLGPVGGPRVFEIRFELPEMLASTPAPEPVPASEDADPWPPWIEVRADDNSWVRMGTHVSWEDFTFSAHDKLTLRAPAPPIPTILRVHLNRTDRGLGTQIPFSCPSGLDVEVDLPLPRADDESQARTVFCRLVISTARVIVCPKCRKIRPEFSNALPHDEYQARVDGYMPCCNPDCKGEWGTGCWHCHHPSYYAPGAPEDERVLRHAFAGAEGASEGDVGIKQARCPIERIAPGWVETGDGGFCRDAEGEAVDFVFVRDGVVEIDQGDQSASAPVNVVRAAIMVADGEPPAEPIVPRRGHREALTGYLREKLGHDAGQVTRSGQLATDPASVDGVGDPAWEKTLASKVWPDEQAKERDKQAIFDDWAKDILLEDVYAFLLRRVKDDAPGVAREAADLAARVRGRILDPAEGPPVTDVHVAVGPEAVDEVLAGMPPARRDPARERRIERELDRLFRQESMDGVRAEDSLAMLQHLVQSCVRAIYGAVDDIDAVPEATRPARVVYGHLQRGNIRFEHDAAVRANGDDEPVMGSEQDEEAVERARADRVDAELDHLRRATPAAFRRIALDTFCAIWCAVEDLSQIVPNLHPMDIVQKHLQRGNIVKDGKWGPRGDDMGAHFLASMKRETIRCEIKKRDHDLDCLVQCNNKAVARKLVTRASKMSHAICVSCINSICKVYPEAPLLIVPLDG